MIRFIRTIAVLTAFAVPAFATVTVKSPAKGAKLTSPVAYVATATTTCSKGVASIGVYLGSKLEYSTDSKSLNAAVSLPTGAQKTIVEERDNCGGSSSTTVDLTVEAPPKPTVKISAKATSIVYGKSTTLTVTAAHATTVTVTGSDRSSYTLKPTGGTQIVSPKEKTTYTATAVNAVSTVTAKVTVSVTDIPKPTAKISANPTSVLAGASSILTVVAANATQVVVTGTDSSKTTLAATGGADTVTPAVTTTYTVTATGPGGTASASATVTVTPNPSPTASISANPTSIFAGASSILTVVAANATQVIVTGTDNSKTTLSVTGGTDAVSPATTTTYTVTATGPGGTATASTTLTVMPNPPPTVIITANPTSVGLGNPSTLTVTSTYATSVTIMGSDGSKPSLTSSTGGLASVTPSATTTYTANATGPGGNTSASATVTVVPNPQPSVTITANPTTVVAGNASTLSVTASNATQLTIAGSDNSSYTLSNPAGGTQSVTPTADTTYTVTATGGDGTTPVTAQTSVTVKPAGSIEQIDHVVFMLQENHSFDNYLGMLNPYRVANGWNIGDDGNTYSVDGIDDKLNTSLPDDEGASIPLFKFQSTCIDDDSSAWLASYGDVNRYNFSTTRAISMNGFVHTAEGYAKSCAASSTCSGAFTDLTGQRAMGYYDQGFLNYYYYMASQFAVSDRWFSPISSKSIDNRIATFTGGTTQGLVNDPGGDDHLKTQLVIPNIFEELDQAKVSWKVYYTVTQGFCLTDDDCTGGASVYPATDFSSLNYSYKYMYENPTGAACIAPTQASSVVGDTTNSFCIDPNKIAPISAYYTDLANGTLPSFAFIEAGYANNDEHPGSGQSVLAGQAEVAKVVNAFMASSSWNDSVFFFSYDEGGGPYDHVPPVLGHSNDFTDASLGTIPDIASIAVNPDSYNPCVPPSGTPTLHCDLTSTYPGATPTDAAAVNGFAAQLGFRLPNTIISPFTRRHYVSHIPMDHTAVIKFVENRFIGSAAHLTARDAAQPNLLDFFDFNNIPWATPPTPPSPVTAESLGYNPCTPTSM